MSEREGRASGTETKASWSVEMKGLEMTGGQTERREEEEAGAMKREESGKLLVSLKECMSPSQRSE